MSDQRVRLFIGLLVVVVGLTLLRVVSQRNVVYDAIEPVLAPLDELAADISANSPATFVDDDQVDKVEGEARVTRRDLNGINKIVWIDQGKQDGLSANKVLTANNSLFGVVEEVYDSTALVRTVLDPQFRSTAVVEDKHGVIKIEFGSLIVDLLADSNLAGKQLKTDGLDGRLPIGVPVGVLDQRITSSSDLLSAYSIRLPFNVYDVTTLSVWGEE